MRGVRNFAVFLVHSPDLAEPRVKRYGRLRPGIFRDLDFQIAVEHKRAAPRILSMGLSTAVLAFPLGNRKPAAPQMTAPAVGDMEIRAPPMSC